MLIISMKIEFSPAEKEAIAKKEDWDFRGVPGDMLWLAKTYECAREAHRVVEDVRRWHDAKLKLRRDFEGFSE